MKCTALTYATHTFLFHYIPLYTGEPTASNPCLGSLCEELYPFIKPLPVRDKKSESFISIDYNPPLVSREDKYFGNLPHDKIPGKTGNNNETNKNGEPNSPNIPVLNAYGIIYGAFILPPH